MTKDELITKQQLEIEGYKIAIAENYKLKTDLLMRFYAIGQPLNDNKLQFNKPQMMWCFKTVELVESINCLETESYFS
jgi:hypothetical protein